MIAAPVGVTVPAARRVAVAVIWRLARRALCCRLLIVAVGVPATPTGSPAPGRLGGRRRAVVVAREGAGRDLDRASLHARLAAMVDQHVERRREQADRL